MKNKQTKGKDSIGTGPDALFVSVGKWLGKIPSNRFVGAALITAVGLVFVAYHGDEPGNVFTPATVALLAAVFVLVIGFLFFLWKEAPKTRRVATPSIPQFGAEESRPVDLGTRPYVTTKVLPRRIWASLLAATLLLLGIVLWQIYELASVSRLQRRLTEVTGKGQDMVRDGSRLCDAAENHARRLIFSSGAMPQVRIQRARFLIGVHQTESDIQKDAWLDEAKAQLNEAVRESRGHGVILAEVYGELANYYRRRSEDRSFENGISLKDLGAQAAVNGKAIAEAFGTRRADLVFRNINTPIELSEIYLAWIFAQKTTSPAWRVDAIKALEKARQIMGDAREGSEE